MPQYVILLLGDEAAWQRANGDERAATYDRHLVAARAARDPDRPVTAP